MAYPTKKIALCGVLTGLALIFGYIESLFPLFANLPGIKLGLANLAILFALYKLGWKYAAFINVCRILLSALLFGNTFSMLYSAFGGVFAFICMLLLKKTNIFSLCGVSIGGGFAHNLGQMVACLIFTQTKAILHYAPALIISGTIFGLITGIIAALVLNRIKNLNI